MLVINIYKINFNLHNCNYNNKSLSYIFLFLKFNNIMKKYIIISKFNYPNKNKIKIIIIHLNFIKTQNYVFEIRLYINDNY